ncbi:SDR family NAD(P)-dependent oxidoreductase [Aquidulcibacter paucihalophilus]|uniref:SDR family NAD(P)-dependent oxidoreductase n=1 Tax=Aquidulcibacter paucihalophilus TaxID=1978549 RepID=UPI000A18F102|nr:SDR family oxidoreductase [Aquidulcibacter paucihalophilus]
MGKGTRLPAWAQGLLGRQAVVTGASRGLGSAIAIYLAEAGARVHAVARNAVDLQELADQNANILPMVGDVTDPEFIADLGKLEIDILVNNAGMNRPLPIQEVDPETLDRMLELNVRAAYLVAQAAVKSMLAHGRGGSIINITSQMGHVGSPRRTVYCMTKHALEGLTKAMAVELAPHGIRANSVAPTFIETPMTKPMLDDPAFFSFVKGMIPMGKIGQVEDVAAAVLYLASPASGMVTGTSLLVDGGWTAQ